MFKLASEKYWSENTNDLFNEIPVKTDIVMYADDTLLMSSSSDINTSVSKCQCLLDKVMIWCKLNKLTVNIMKTKSMYINSINARPVLDLCIDGKPLGVVKQFEYLGMQIDDRLQLNKHVENKYKKSRCKLGILYKIRKFITCQTALLLYKVMIRPFMEYGDFIVDSALQTVIDKLERLQEKSLRLIEYQSNVNRLSMSNLKSKFKIENLETRRNRSLLRLMFTQSKKAENIKEVKEHMVLRNSTKVKLVSDFTRLTKVQHSPYYRGLKLCDKLPERVQKEPSKLKFKREIVKLIA